MAERIELPGTLQGTADQKLEAMYSYLYQMAKTMNANLAEIGPAALTDDEQVLMNQISLSDNGSVEMPNTGSHSWQEQETLKSLIIKTATIVKTALDAWRLQVFGETEADSDMGRYLQKTGLRVDVTPGGIKQTYSFAEIIKGLKTYEINAKNYIKSGYLRTENNIPIYGVAVGRDIVTFAEDGTETYHDGNKVAELTADELSFYQNSKKIASYKGDEISFYNNNIKMASLTANALTFYQNNKTSAKFQANRIGLYNNGTEYMYMTNGKIYAADDLIINSGHAVYIGEWRFNDNGLLYYSNNNALLQFGRYANKIPSVKSGVFSGYSGNGVYNLRLHANSNSYTDFEILLSEYGVNGMCFYPAQLGCCLGAEDNDKHWSYGWIDSVMYNILIQNSSRDIKHDIQDMESQGERIDGLRPVTFIYDSDPDEKKRFGLIYEDAIEVMPEICTGDEGRKAINYVEMIPMLVKEIQELRARVRALEEREER